MSKLKNVRSLLFMRDLKESDNLKNLGIDGKIILKYIFENWDLGSRTALI